MKQTLMIFIRATIIKDPDIARTLSHRKYNFMRDTQLSNYDEDKDAGRAVILEPLEPLEPLE